MKIKISLAACSMLVILLFSERGFTVSAKDLGANEGLKISFDQVSSAETKNIIVQGTLSTFIACGSQYAIWRQFPTSIRYTVKNLDSEDIYNSIDMQLSISESGNDIFDFYRKEPCDTVVSKDFSITLNEIFFEAAPEAKIFNFELQAEYAGYKSNVLLFKNMPFGLKSF